MSMPQDTWFIRDLPVLLAVATRLDQEPGTEILVNDVHVSDITADDVDRAFDALVQVGHRPRNQCTTRAARQWLVD